jgi:nickel-dependent lactate racemase
MVDCWLPYGETEIYVSVEMDNLVSEAKPKNIVPEKTPEEIIREALTEASSGTTLEELVKPDCRVAIALEGTTNPRAAVKTVSIIVRELVELIVPTDRITLLIGNGARSQSSPQLMAELRAANELKSIRILEHTRNTSDLQEIGETHQGTPVYVNRQYMDSTVKIAIGETRLDSYQGFKGAFNAVFPGLASLQGIEANRKLYFEGKSGPGIVELNPIKEDIVQIVNFIGVDMSINLTLNYDDQLTGAYVGGFLDSWGRSINGLSDSFELEPVEPSDIVIVSAGGFQSDYDLYNAAWGIENASRVIKRNGTIILLTECSEGIGADALTSLARVEEQSEFQRRYKLGADVLQMIKRILRNNNIILVSALPRYLVEQIGLSAARTANEAYSMAIGTRRSRKTTVFPYGCTSTFKTGSHSS